MKIFFINLISLVLNLHFISLNHLSQNLAEAAHYSYIMRINNLKDVVELKRTRRTTLPKDLYCTKAETNAKRLRISMSNLSRMKQEVMSYELFPIRNATEMTSVSKKKFVKSRLILVEFFFYIETKAFRSTVKFNKFVLKFHQ